jgi:glycosyltransferase involved in cell wall biosynthesis
MRQKPRILILSTAYLPLIGGSELAIHHIAERLPEYDFDLVTGRYDSSAPLMEQVGRIRVFRAGGRWARVSFFVPKLLLPIAIAISALRLMRTHHYVAVHAYQVSQAAGAAMLIQLFRPHTPLIVTIQVEEIAKKSHADGFLKKPFNIEELIQVTRKYIASK